MDKEQQSRFKIRMEIFQFILIEIKINRIVPRSTIIWVESEMKKKGVKRAFERDFINFDQSSFSHKLFVICNMEQDQEFSNFD